MAITTSTLSVPNFNGEEKKLKTLRDSADNTDNPAHPLMDPAGAIISPSTAQRQDAGNAALTAILAKLPSSPASEAGQVDASTKLDAIAANTAAGGVTRTVALTVTPGTYSDGMVVGGKISIVPAARANGGSGLLQQVIVGKKATQTAPFDVFVFHTNPAAAFTDHEDFPDISADFDKLVGVIRCTDVVDCGVPRILQALQQALQFDLPSDGNTLYLVSVIRGSDTYATPDAVTVIVGILQD